MAKRQQQEQKGSLTEQAAPDPTVRSDRRPPEYPEGTHPVVDPADVTWNADRLTYGDLPDDEKPARDTVAQTVESDPIEDEAQETLRSDAEQYDPKANQSQ